jgi:hypothetical protein
MCSGSENEGIVSQLAGIAEIVLGGNVVPTTSLMVTRDQIFSPITQMVAVVG